MDPKSILAAQGANEKELVNALVREPLGALGLAVPEVPTPGELGAQVLGQLPAPPGLPGAKLEVGATPRTEASKPPVKPRVWRIG
jgi:hypothetical protein